MSFRINFLFLYTVLCLLALYNANKFVADKWLKRVKIVGFTWKNCGSDTDPAQVKSLFISPDPIVVPGNVNFNTSFSLTTECPDDVTVSVVLEKRIAGQYVKIPCVDNIGSCTYTGICDAWNQVCQQYFSNYSVPCTCPIPPKLYSIPDVSIEIDATLPSILDGGFRVSGTLNTGSTRIICLQVEVSLSG